MYICVCASAAVHFVVTFSRSPVLVIPLHSIHSTLPYHLLLHSALADPLFPFSLFVPPVLHLPCLKSLPPWLLCIRS